MTIFQAGFGLNCQKNWHIHFNIQLSLRLCDEFSCNDELFVNMLTMPSPSKATNIAYNSNNSYIKENNDTLSMIFQNSRNSATKMCYFPLGKRPVCKRSQWGKEESSVVLKHYADKIKKGILPGKSDATQLIAESAVLKNRTC